MEVEPYWWKNLENKDLTHPDDEKDNNLMKNWKGKASGENIPSFGWRISLNHKFQNCPKSWNLPPLTQLPSLVGLGVRYLQFYKQRSRVNKKPCMDFFNQMPLNQIYGVPLGGIGGGTINRGWGGDFCKWQFQPGVYSFDSPPADQFIITIRRKDKPTFQRVLSTRPAPDCHLTSWNWSFDGSFSFYHGLYPRAWTVYEFPTENVVLTCRQISPVFPNEYKDTSLPCAVFVWNAENLGSEEIDIAITMTMECGTGDAKLLKETAGMHNKSFEYTENDKVEMKGKVKGVEMHNTSYPDMPYTMTVAATEKENVEVNHCTYFNPRGNGEEVWNPLLQNGKLSDNHGESRKTVKGEPIGCGISCSTSIKPNSKSSTIEFSLCWDMPKIHFGDKRRTYRRRYTRWFSCHGNAGPDIAGYALAKYPEWETLIDNWQSTVLDNSQLPSWYKSAIFNELYYVTDGGTIWLEADSLDSNDIQSNGVQSTAEKKLPKSEEEIRNCSLIQEYGRFAYLEGQEYKMYNTYDVHFYASIALAALWPKLELSLQYDIAAAILHSNTERRKYLMEGVRAPIKTPNVVPHDVGCPDDEPWLEVNSYFVHDTADWKDLNPKFVLQTYRDYFITKDRTFLETMWPICKTVMEASMKHDKDGDGLIENSGQADQTFDGWFVKGPSAYCGGLWLAALRFMVETAKVLEDKENEDKFKEILERAKTAYEKWLWNGSYYNYDSNPNRQHSTSVMADQLAGQWFLMSTGIYDVLPEGHAEKALHKVFSLNVEQYDGGRSGAVNGMKPHGKVDSSSVQSNEVWTGVTYALASTMMLKGMFKEGFRTASGIYRSCWQRYGMAYQTPEAFKQTGVYRSLAYMRPLAVWGLQFALENNQQVIGKPCRNGSTVVEDKLVET